MGMLLTHHKGYWPKAEAEAEKPEQVEKPARKAKVDKGE